MLLLICATYLSGTENSIFILSIFWIEAILEAELTNEPSLTYFKPILPLNGATISVCFILSFSISISALVEFKSVSDKSYAS